MATVKFKVYGKNGFCQMYSFMPSYTKDLSNEQDGVRKIVVENSDMTDTNKYSLVTIIRNTLDECHAEIKEQIANGIFKEYDVGRVIAVSGNDDEDNTRYPYLPKDHVDPLGYIPGHTEWLNEMCKLRAEGKI